MSAWKGYKGNDYYINGSAPNDPASQLAKAFDEAFNINEAELITKGNIEYFNVPASFDIEVTSFLFNDNKILCRKEVQRRKKRGISLEPDADEIFYNWSKSTIGKILTNETYIENVVQNRTTTVSYKNHKIIYKPRGRMGSCRKYT